METVKLTRGEEAGILTWDDEKKGKVKYNLTTGFPKLRQDVKVFMNKKQQFRIPAKAIEGEDDNYRDEEAVPVSSRNYFPLALCRLFAFKDIQVSW